MYRAIYKLVWIYNHSILGTCWIYYYFHLQSVNFETIEGERVILKKMIIFLVIIIALFAGISLVTKLQNEEKVVDNPYHKETLDSSTIAQLDDPNYQNLILPEELEKKIADEDDVTVYFYSPTCPHCQRTTPIVDPLSEEMDIDLVQYNLLEFEQGWDDYQIESTPTIVQFKDGKETARIVGYNEESVFTDWFTKNTKQ